MAPTEQEEKDYGRTDSYRVAVTPFVPDDGRTSDGRPKSRRRRPPSNKGSKSLSAITEEIEAFKDHVDLDEHRIPLDELYSRYATDPNMGLTVPRIKEVQDVYGMNQQSPTPKTPEWVKLAKNLMGGFSLILWVGCCLSLITFSIQKDIMERPPYENLALGIILGFVVLLTGLFSFYQEVKADNLVESLKMIAPQYCSVIREGRRQVIPTEYLVMGDVVELKAGEKIPADIRIINSHNFRVDQSSMTGDMEPQAKSSELTSDNPLETLNLAFCGTYATEGMCRGIVIRTGDFTMMASMSHITVVLQDSDVLLTDEITWWMHCFTSVAVCIAGVLFIVAFAAGFHWLDAIILLIGVTVAIVPEGLLAVVTICLTLAAKRLYKKNCLMKTLSSVDKVGAVSAILVDKNDALTQNKLTAAHMWIDGKIVTIDNTDNQSEGAEHYRNTASFQALSRIAALCNSAEFSDAEDESPPDRREAIGDTNDVALLRLMEKALGSVGNVRSRHRKVCEIPFHKTGKYQLTIHDSDPADPGYVLLMKGAPEDIVQRCTTILQNGKEWHLDDKTKEFFTKAFIELGNLGEKVIAFCDFKLPPQKYPSGYPFDADEGNFPMNGFRFVGLLSLADPLRPTVPDAVSNCRTAGIRVVMVTGDHPITARAIARSSGIFSAASITVEDVATARNIQVEKVNSADANAAIVHGAELKTMSPDRLHFILSNYHDVIFARTALQQKLQIVEGLQRMGCVVAVTGVGVIDVPAVKIADIGVALGNSNTDVVKQAADIVLLDNNFATVVTAIEEGRLVFENMRKSISYMLASNMPEFLPYIIFLILGVPLPLGTITILLIDMGTDMLPAISLAYEAPEEDLMKKGPRNDYQHHLIDIQLIDIMDAQIGMIQAAAGFFTYFVCFAENGFWFSHLLYTRRKWNAVAQSDYEDSYFQNWTYEQRKRLEWTAHSSFFVSIVMCQWITLLMCKTRRLSLFQQGFWNHYLNFALVFETLLAILVIYCPGMDKALNMMPVRINWWITALPYLLGIFVYEEARKLIIRRNPKGWTQKAFH